MTIAGALSLGPEDEVIVPSFTFIATANCVKFLGAKPVFADIDPATFTLDPEDVYGKINSHTKAHSSCPFIWIMCRYGCVVETL